ncbi:MAG: DnaA regulatory inactivator Hda [Burkholderiaceae bacterium]|nr:DnaA regulatory inactivator Hda [Burkholderiaceae bacterium]
MKQIALDIGLAPEPGFETFVAGRNASAVQHLRLWCAGAGARSPVPVYLWGESGAGKTHLLRAARQAIGQQGGLAGWLSPQTDPTLPFSAGWDVVVFDDVQDYDAEHQHTAFNWFVNAVTPAEGAPRGVLAAGTLPPADLPLREDLRTRLGWGHVFELAAPSEAERRAILRRAADARGVFLSDEVMDFVLARFARDLGSLMALLEQIDRYALRAKRAITIPLIKEMLADS